MAEDTKPLDADETRDDADETRDDADDTHGDADASAAEPRATAPEGRAEAAGKEGEGGPPAKKGGSSIMSVLGFVAALGGGFFIGQWLINRKDDAGVELEQGPRYKVDLRGDEPQRGPADALVTIIEFADYQCPYCAKAAPPLLDAADDFDEDVRIIFKHYPLGNHPKAIPAARAAWAAHQQGKFWPMHEWLFEQKAELAGIETRAQKLGMDVQKLLADTASEESAKSVDSDFFAGAKIGVTGTPVFFVNGHRYVGTKSASQWRTIIEGELAEAERLVEAGTPRAQVFDTILADAITQESGKKRREGEPDPDVTYRIPIDDRPSLGPADALVTVVLFSDFQCPYCAQLGDVVHQLVDGASDVRVVFRNLPLPMHPRAREAAKAGLAAGRQGKFWEMHDLMFAEQKSLGDVDFASLAERLGLDGERFATDFADPELERLVAEDEALAASFGIRGTPAAFVNGRFVGGARPLAAYQSLAGEERSRAQALVDGGTAPAQVYDAIMADAATSVQAAPAAEKEER